MTSRRPTHPQLSGFSRRDRAAHTTSGWPLEAVRLVSRSPLPDSAAETIFRVGQEHPELQQQVIADDQWLTAIANVVGASDALGRRLEMEPDLLYELRPPLKLPSTARLRAKILAARDVDDVRRLYHRQLLLIAAHDVISPDPLAVLPQVARRLSDAADAVVEALLRLARKDLFGDVSAGPPLAVVAMGKCGAQELNYVSDVDVIWITEGEGADVDAACRLAGEVTRLCGSHGSTGTLWPLDGGLRPEGNAGPLVRTLDAMRAYYRQWAKPWEFQALLKARPMAGNLELARRFCEVVEPYVWKVGDEAGFVGQVQAMRQRVVKLLPPKEAHRELKLGKGGLRDVEFTVQLLQLVHGRTDDRIRQRGTLEALQALIDHGYVGRHDGERLRTAYLSERLLEHRAQLLKLRRTHLLPHDPPTLERLNRGLSATFPTGVEATWKQCSREVLALHQRIFYSPLLEAVAAVPTDEASLSPQAIDARLRAVGFEDARTARQHIQALTSGHRRRAEIQRQLMPALLSWLGQTPNPDAGLLALRRLGEALGDTRWYLKALRDEGTMAPRLTQAVGTSRYVVDLLLRDAASVQMLTRSDEVAPRSQQEIQAELAHVVARAAGVEESVASIRVVRRRELLRLALASMSGEADVAATGRGLTALMSACVDVTLRVCADTEKAPLVGVIAMGRWGGGELGFGSDGDAMFVVEEAADVDAASRAVALARKLLEKPSTEPSLQLDADLRPEGRSGPMVRSVEGYRTYYAQWASPWEAQALLRARAMAGHLDVASAVVDSVAELRWPPGGPSPAALLEMRKLKARMESERTRGSDPRRHTKLGPGALSDVEWTVQLLQLRHAAAHPEMRTTSTLGALQAAVGLGLVDPDDADVLSAAWELATRVRNAAVLVRGKVSDVLPADARELGAVAQLLGYDQGATSAFVDDYFATMRHSRLTTERLFFQSKE